MKQNLIVSATTAVLMSALALAGCNKAQDGASASATPPASVVASTPAVPPPSTASASQPVVVDAKAEICSGCGKPESECTCHEAAGEKPAPGPASITLASGKSVPVVGVAALNENPKAHSGLIAIDGTVGELYVDKGRFMLVDCATAAACDDPGCASCSADMKVPVRIDVASVKGSWPAAKQRVLVVADVQPTATGGFTLAVHEIRAGEKTVLTTSAKSDKA